MTSRLGFHAQLAELMRRSMATETQAAFAFLLSVYEKALTPHQVIATLPALEEIT